MGCMHVCVKFAIFEQICLLGCEPMRLISTDVVCGYYPKDGVTRLQSPMTPGMDATGTTHVIALML